MFIKLSQRWKNGILALQHLVAMFGATTLVPLLVGFEVPVALFTAGVGTLIFHFLTERKVPVFLGSSFAFIPLIIAVVNNTGSIRYAQGGIIVAGLIYVLLSYLVSIVGMRKISRVLKPHVVGTVIAIIGLTLIPVAIDMSSNNIVVASFTLGVAIVARFLGRGLIRQTCILIGVVSGYVLGLSLGIVETELITQASFLQVPNFTLPLFNLESIFIIAPVVVAVFMEHVGDIVANQTVVGKNFLKDPGIHKTLLGDGVATVLAGMLGGPANTTYSENTSVLAFTENYNPFVLRLAAVFAIIISFLGQFGAILASVPVSVIGGISILLFGMISKIGIETLTKDNFHLDNRKLITVIVMLVLGLSPVWSYHILGVEMAGVSVAALVGVLMTVLFNYYEDYNGNH